MEQQAAKTEPLPIAGLLAEFEGPEALKVAAAALRESGYTRLEAYSPFPVHGIDAALGRRRTRLPRLVLAAGTAGGLGALLLQWWTNAVDYPLLISGKPFFSLPANIPIIFELIILASALAAFAGGLALSGLPELFHPLLSSERFRRATTDAFFVTLEASDPQFEETSAAELFRSLGAISVETYRRPVSQRKIPRVLIGFVAVLLALALLPSLWIAKQRYQRSATPRLNLISDMDFQPKYLPQQFSPLFADGRDMRLPVPGTVAADQEVHNPHLLLGEVDGKPATTFPLPVTAELMARGRQRFGIFCATCHGLAGDGDGITSQLAFQREEPKWVRPLSIHSQVVRELPVGKLFQVISHGIRTMPSYGSQIPVGDRWAIVLYLRALQRSREAKLEEVPRDMREQLKSTGQDHAD
jgi:mono/diheme cytochrome c family protein